MLFFCPNLVWVPIPYTASHLVWEHPWYMLISWTSNNLMDFKCSWNVLAEEWILHDHDNDKAIIVKTKSLLNTVFPVAILLTGLNRYYINEEWYISMEKKNVYSFFKKGFPLVIKPGHHLQVGCQPRIKAPSRSWKIVLLHRMSTQYFWSVWKLVFLSK